MQKNAATSSQKIQVSLAAKCRTESRKVHLSMHWFVEDPIQCRRLQCIERHICSYAGLKKLDGSSSFQKRHSTCGFVGHPHTLSFWPSRRELTTIRIPKNKSAALDSPKHLWPWTTFRILIESLWDPSIKDLFSSHIGISDVFFLILGKYASVFSVVFAFGNSEWIALDSLISKDGQQQLSTSPRFLSRGHHPQAGVNLSHFKNVVPSCFTIDVSTVHKIWSKKRLKKMDLRAIIC